MNDDQVIITGRAGGANLPEGQSDVMRLTRRGALLMAGLHGQFMEASRLGRVFVASNAVAGVDHGNAFTTTPPICLWNPLGSGVNISILKAVMAYLSGTLGAVPICWGYTPAQVNAPTTGTELVPVSALLGSARGSGRAYTGSTLVAAPSIIRPAFQTGAALATTVAFSSMCEEINDGELTLPPGVALALQGAGGAAGTTPRVIFGIVWEEVPI